MAITGDIFYAAPYRKFAAVTNGDAYGPGTAHPEVPDGVWIATAGNLTVVDANGVSSTFTAIPAGTLIPISPATITTAPASTLVLYR